jgi:phosphoglycerate dehydrogenase-like enzyme
VPKPRLLILSRQGRKAITPAHRRQLRALANVAYAQRAGAPSTAAASRLLEGIEIFGATGATLPSLDAALLGRLQHLRHIVLHATGTDLIDLRLLGRLGIRVTSLPDYATTAVAEHALGLLLASSQRLHLANDVSRGVASPHVSLRGMELAGRTVFAVGLGRIGLAFAQLAQGIGLRVTGSDIDRAAEARAAARGVTILPFRQGLNSADAVVLCASRQLGQGPLLDDQAIAALKPQAFVVNVGRAALADNEAIAAALRSRRLRGYAVDAVAFDPIRHVDLIAEGRVLQTAHSAWWKDEALARGREMWGTALIAAAAAEAEGETESRHPSHIAGSRP